MRMGGCKSHFTLQEDGADGCCADQSDCEDAAFLDGMCCNYPAFVWLGNCNTKNASTRLCASVLAPGGRQIRSA
jgi:hypothetical protein